MVSEERELEHSSFNEKIERIFHQVEQKTSGLNDDFDLMNAVEIDEIKRTGTELNNNEIN